MASMIVYAAAVKTKGKLRGAQCFGLAIRWPVRGPSNYWNNGLSWAPSSSNDSDHCLMASHANWRDWTMSRASCFLRRENMTGSSDHIFSIGHMYIFWIPDINYSYIIFINSFCSSSFDTISVLHTYIPMSMFKLR